MYAITNPSGFVGVTRYGPHSLEFGPGGVATVETLTPQLAQWLYAAGYRIEETTPTQFDPSEYTVKDLLPLLADMDAGERAQVLEAEANGKARPSVLNHEWSE